MKKYLQIFLLLVAMLLPWATQAQVSCPPGQTSCNVVVMMWDSYGDGWDYGDCYLEFYSGSTLLGSASLLDGSTGSTTVPVCEGDSIRVVWNDPWDGYTDEISFLILSMGGDTLMEVNDASMYNDGQTMTTFEATCPSCMFPMNFTLMGTQPTSVTVGWSGSDGSSYEVVYGPTGFNPNTDGASQTTIDDTLLVENLSADTTYDFYVRTDCGSEMSNWAGPLTLRPGVIAMPVTGIDTLRVCSAVITDDGGLTGPYSTYCDATYVIYPSEEGNTFTLSGTSYTEGTWDYLRIYDGVGTSGQVLFDDYGVSSSQNFGPFVSEEGVITVVFHSDGSNQYSGFQVNLSCVPLPDCPRPGDFTLVSLSDESATFSWIERGSATSWVLEYGVQGFEPGSDSAMVLNVYDTTAVIDELLPNTAYDVYLYADCGSEYSLSRLITFRTACVAIDSLPYSYGFEDATANSSSGEINPCWKRGRINTTTAYPYPSSTAASGSHSLYFYGYYTSSLKSYAAMPMFADSLNTLQVSFKLRAYNTSYNYYGNSLTVGVMVDPEDINTFEPVETFTATSTSTWDEFTCFFTNYEGQGRYIAFLSGGLNSTAYYGYVYLDDVVVDYVPECGTVTDLEVSAGPVSALATWEPSPVGEPVSYTVAYRVADPTDEGAWTEISVTTPYCSITGLDVNTDYELRVATNCSEGTSNWNTVEFSTKPCMAGGDIVLNAPGSTTTFYYPLNNYYNYSYTQELITADELSGATEITGIKFEYAYNSPSTSKNNCTIYIGHTNATSLSSGWTNVPMQAVYTGALNCHSGWNEFTFTTPFQYDGVSNLVVAVDDNSGGYNGSSYVFAAHNVSDKSRYVCSDTYNFNPASDLTNSSYPGTTNTYRANMALVSSCDSEATCVPPIASIVGATSETVSVVWAPGNEETSWNLYSRLDGATNFTFVGAVTETEYTFTNLQSGSQYYFKVEAICGSDTVATIVDTRTECATITSVPFVENFDNWGAGTGVIPTCWSNDGSYSGYPYISSSTGAGYDHTTGSGHALYMYTYASSSTPTYIMLPPLDSTLGAMNQYQVSFAMNYASSSSYVHGVIVGICEESDFSTFVPIDTVILSQAGTNNWEFFEVPFANYADSGRTVALRGYTTTSYCYPYIDDLTISVIPTCPRPRDIEVDNITQSDATIHWVDSTASTMIVEYGPFGFALGTGTQVLVSGADSVDITGLVANTLYDVYVRGVCSGTDSSEWAFRTTFRTDCGELVIPFYENFDSYVGGSPNFPACWYRPVMESSYPYLTNTTSYVYNGSGNAIMFAGAATVVTPRVPVPANEIELTFNLRREGASSGSIEVGWVSDPNTLSDFRSIAIIDQANTSVYEEFSFAFDTLTTTDTGYICFRQISTSTIWYYWLDEVYIEQMLPCHRSTDLAATNATPTTVDLSWNCTSNPSSWIVEYGPVGFELGTGTQVVATSNPFTLTGLTTATEYEYYVRSICGAGDSSYWSRTSCRFATSQIPAAIPYNYNFEDAAEWANWQTNSNGSINWYRGNADAGEGSYSLYISADSGATVGNSDFSSVVNASAYRDIDFGSIDSSFTFTFKAKVGGTTTGAYDGLMVFLVDPSVPVVASTANITSPWGNVNDLYVIESVRLDTNWDTYTASFDHISGVHRVAFFWFNQSTGGSSSYPFIGGPAEVDDLSIDYSACPRPSDLEVVRLGATSATISWRGPSNGTYQVLYRPYPSGTVNQYMIVNTNSCTITGLDTLTQYIMGVRKICGADTSIFSDGILFNTTICDNASVADLSNTGAESTGYYTPINNYYNYTLTQTIVLNEELGVMPMDISAIGFNYAYSSPSTAKTDVDIYIQPTTKTSFSGTSDVEPLDTVNAVLVYSGPLNCEEGWNIFELDTTYSYDGTSNLMVIVDDNSSDYDGSAYVFYNSATTSAMTLTYYSDSENPNVNNPGSFSGNKSTYNYRAQMQLISCGAGCSIPLIISTEPTYNSVVVNWSGNATDYEVSYKSVSDADFTTPVAVAANTYTLTGLTPATQYTFRVRSLCDSGAVSDWASTNFVTDSLPCFAPEDLHQTAIAYTSVTLDWTNGGNEQNWVVKVFNSRIGEILDTVSAHPATITGLTANEQYFATVQAACGSTLDGFSDWSDTISFTTSECVAVSNISCATPTNSSVEISWTSNGSESAWIVEYGMPGFGQGEELGRATATTNPYQLSLAGLDPNTTYEVYVYAQCMEGLTSVPAGPASFTTNDIGISGISGNADINIYPNPTTGSTTISVSGISGKVNVAIVDMNGREVMNSAMECDGDCEKVMNVDGLAQGAYFVRIYGEEINSIRKLIVR